MVLAIFTCCHQEKEVFTLTKLEKNGILYLIGDFISKIKRKRLRKEKCDMNKLSEGLLP